jgi:patatin-related protein
MGNPAELRLALVCYGGVSLAVYMHGVTKELQSLIRAARAYDKASLANPDNPFRAGKPPYGTEAAYFDALKDLARKGRRLSVSIDIIGGTSAGGINGIALSKGLALGASQQPLKKVWIDDGDIRRLLRAPSWPGLLLQTFIAATRQAVRFSSPTSPLRGDLMSRLILGALEEMDAATCEPTLIPAGGSLELFVPATDLDGFDVLVPSGAGGASQRDRLNAQVFEFRAEHTDTAQGQFGESFTPDLAFAGRASASFPGAFAPVSQESFEKETGRQHLEFHSAVFQNRYPDDEHAKKVYFVDGGVLDNAPFDVVITAISRRRADSEVYRRIAYIEPDPGRDLYSAAVATLPSHRRWLKDLMTVSKVKGNHPILRDLLALRDMNVRIGDVSAIVERQKEYVVGAVAWVLDAQRGPREPTSGPLNPGSPGATQLMLGLTENEEIQTLSDKMHVWARDALGPTFSTYQRLKFQSAIERLATELARRFHFSPQSGQASFLRAAIVAWARAQDFWKYEPAITRGDKLRVTEEPGDTLADKLRPIDAPYRERRLMFIVAGINELYSPTGEDNLSPPREDLDKLKAAAWELLGGIRNATQKVVANIPEETVEFLRLEAVDRPGSDSRDDPVLADPSAFATDNAARFDALFAIYKEDMAKQLGDGGSELWSAFKANTSDKWTDTDRQTLLSRYQGFPLWDGMIFPTISMTRLPQFTPIGVSQFSPLMATKLTALDEKGNPTEKLMGIPFKHFAGFFDAKSRENDYLWGRLDGVELILRLLQEVDRSDAPSAAEAGGVDESIPHLADGLTAVLDTEADLKRISKLRESLKKQVANLADVEAAATRTRAAHQPRRAAAAEEGGQTLTV